MIVSPSPYRHAKVLLAGGLLVMSYGCAAGGGSGDDASTGGQGSGDGDMTMGSGGSEMMGSGGTDSEAALVEPILRDGKVVFEWGQTLFEVDPAYGGRITRYEYGGQDILAGPNFHEIYWGSTLWTSPESDWSQPPPVAHDSGPYDVTSGTALPVVMLAAADSTFSNKQVKVRKTFDVDLVAGAVVVSYEIINTSPSETFSLAAWEVTRLPGGGLSFFPHVGTSNATAGISVAVQDGIAWFDHTQHVEPGGQKLWADGAEGWLAHVSGDLLYIKQFPPIDAASAAPGENEVEIYSSNVATEPTAYIELEVQSSYESLAPGQSVVLPVRWYLVPLTDGLDKSLGSAELVELVRTIIE